jgi:hypothetical protein
MEAVRGAIRVNLLKAILSATLGRMFAEEIKDVLLWLPAKLIHWAAQRMEADLRERYEEEWLGHCADVPGSVAKLWHAIGCTWAAVNTAEDHLVLRVFIRMYAYVTTPLVLPVIIVSEIAETWIKRVLPSSELVLLNLNQVASTSKPRRAPRLLHILIPSPVVYEILIEEMMKVVDYYEPALSWVYRIFGV